MESLPILMVAFGGFIFLADYLAYNFHLILGTLVLLSSIKIKKDQRSNRFLYAIGIGVLILFSLKITFIYYLVWFCCILATIDISYGKVNYAPIFAFLFLSPLFEYINVVFGFPIRIFLSETVIDVMQFFIQDISCSGNVIYFNDIPFTVDEACAGLKTLGLAIASTLILLSFQERITNRHYKFSTYLISLIITIGLVILGNAIRIALLVLFRIPPEAITHDLYGFVIVASHIILPLYLLSKYSSKFNFLFNNSNTPSKVSTKIPYLLFLLIIGLGIRDSLHTTENIVNDKKYPIRYNVEKTNLNDVTKLSNKNTLIYIKPPVKPYQLEHSPTICWRGSGYTFHKIKKTVVNQKTIFTGTLKKKNSKLFTAWWFDNGSDQTINPFQWRYNSLKGSANYQLINVTCTSEEELKTELQNWLQKTTTEN